LFIYFIYKKNYKMLIKLNKNILVLSINIFFFFFFELIFNLIEFTNINIFYDRSSSFFFLNSSISANNCSFILFLFSNSVLILIFSFCNPSISFIKLWIWLFNVFYKYFFLKWLVNIYLIYIYKLSYNTYNSIKNIWYTINYNFTNKK